MGKNSHGQENMHYGSAAKLYSVKFFLIPVNKTQLSVFITVSSSKFELIIKFREEYGICLHFNPLTVKSSVNCKRSLLKLSFPAMRCWTLRRSLFPRNAVFAAAPRSISRTKATPRTAAAKFNFCPNSSSSPLFWARSFAAASANLESCLIPQPRI